MRNILKKAICLTLASMVMLGATACNKKKTEESDPTKSHVWVEYYSAGYGDDWMTAVADAFEKQYADYSFEEGKKGVVVHADGTQGGNYSTAQMEQSKYDVFMTQNESYYALVSDGEGLEDLTDIVTSTNVDGKTILSKMSQQEKDFFGIKDAQNKVTYYGLPYYCGSSGIIYDKDLFDKRNYYIAADQSEGFLIQSKNQKKSNGPDGKEGTPDDGLPATYDEFFMLLDEIAVADTPMVWPGSPYYSYYLGHLFDALVADYEGVDNMMLNYTFSGSEDLVKVNADGSPVLDGNGNPVLENVAINKSNGYDVARQPGKYYAMKFIEKLIGNEKYYYKDSFKTFSQTQAEQSFLEDGTINTNKNIAMLIDGPWWQREASSVFEAMEMKDPKYSAKNRNFGWMPLPKATEEKVAEGGKNVFYDGMSTTVLIKKGTGERLAANKAFVQFMMSDSAMNLFTQKTGAILGYDYKIEDSVLNSLSPFSKSLVEYVSKGDVLYRYSSDKFFNENYSKFKYDVVYGNGVYSNIPSAFYEGKYTAAGYFTSYYNSFKDGQGNLWKNAK